MVINGSTIALPAYQGIATTTTTGSSSGSGGSTSGTTTTGATGSTSSSGSSGVINESEGNCGDACDYHLHYAPNWSGTTASIGTYVSLISESIGGEIHFNPALFVNGSLVLKLSNPPMNFSALISLSSNGTLTKSNCVFNGLSDSSCSGQNNDTLGGQMVTDSIGQSINLAGYSGSNSSSGSGTSSSSGSSSSGSSSGTSSSGSGSSSGTTTGGGAGTVVGSGSNVAAFSYHIYYGGNSQGAKVTIGSNAYSVTKTVGGAIGFSGGTFNNGVLSMTGTNGSMTFLANISLSTSGALSKSNCVLNGISDPNCTQGFGGQMVMDNKNYAIDFPSIPSH